jgi:PAS domain S-box-containing protein
VTLRVPASLRLTVPLILLGFAATLSAVNLLYHAPRAERVAEEDSRKRLAQEMSRLQSTLEYLLLKGDVEVAQHEIAVLAHNHDYIVVVLADDRHEVIAATRRAWLGRQIAEVLPKFNTDQATQAIYKRRAQVTVDTQDNALLAYAGIPMGSWRKELRPSRTGNLFLAYDLARSKAEARTRVLQQSLYWAGWVTALALAMWLAFHFLLTRRTAKLVRAAEQLAAGNLAARSTLRGRDELGRLGRAFDAMAIEVADTQTRLREDIAERARVQQALENSEARLQQILNNTTAVVYVKDIEGRFLFVNRQWERLFHCGLAEAAGKTEREILPNTVAQAFRSNDLLVLERNGPIEFEETLPLDDGSHTYISIKFPLHAASGVAYAVCSILTDITERKRSDEALRVSEASYRAIFDAAEDAIFVLDVHNAAILDLNPKASTAYGYSREELREIDMGTLSSGAPSYTRQDVMTLLARAIAGEHLRFEWHRKNKDGSLHWDEVFVKRVTLGGQNRILALTREITDRKKAEASLRASEEQYRAMFNASIDGLILWNALGEIVDVNPALWEIYGYSQEELSALSLNSLIGPTYNPDFLRSVAAGKPKHVEFTELRKDGSALELEVHAIPMQYQGNPHVLTIARDITDKKRSAEQLARQREALYQREKLAALGSLLAGVAHELNNPLSVVVARAVLLEELGDPATRIAALKIRTAAERCARIVRTFLAMARQQPPERGPVAINEVVTAALDITAYTVRTSSIEMALDLAPDIPPILADADQLHQVLLNLIINAQQALQDQPPPRRIRLSSRVDATTDTIRLTVADNGPGIPVHLRPRVFEPYFTTKPTGIGTGVGLAVSLGIVEAHGGTLTVDCPLGGGTLFSIALPAAPAEAIAADPPRPQPKHPYKRVVLVIDDEAAIRETLAEILEAAGHEVFTATSGREALLRMSAEHYDVILTDIRMPDLDGRDLYREIERRWPERARKVVFMTGDTLTSVLSNAPAEGGPPVIEKPFLPGDVLRVVADITARTEPGNRSTR